MLQIVGFTNVTATDIKTADRQAQAERAMATRVVSDRYAETEAFLARAGVAPKPRRSRVSVWRAERQRKGA